MWYLFCVLFLTGFYLFLICPKIRKNPLSQKLKKVPFAHRGLYHGDEVPENSILAFEKAVEKGFAIELDVRLTKDQKLVIFHDASAKRMCGQDFLIRDMTLHEVKKLLLLKSSFSIPTLEEALAVIKGKVPLLIEMKTDSFKSPAFLLSKKLHDVMKNYSGFYAVESFDPRGVFWFKIHAPKVVRGQLVWRGKNSSLKNVLLRQLLCNFLSRPDFIALEKSCTSVSLKIARLFHPVFLAWTVRNASQWQAIHHKYDQMIFEAFLPQPDAGCIRTFEKEEGFYHE